VHWLRGFVRHLASEARTVLVSSHVLAEVAQTVDEVVIVTGGRVVAHSPIGDLTAVIAGSVCIRTAHASALHDHLATEGIASRLAAADVVVNDGSDDVVGRSVARSGLPIYEMSADRSLEDAFLQLTATSAGWVVRSRGFTVRLGPDCWVTGRSVRSGRRGRWPGPGPVAAAWRGCWPRGS
jgi:ABC-2 type transport system ATP-binding protein